MPDVFQEVTACVEVAIKAVYVPTGTEMVNVLNFQCNTAEPTTGDVEACVSIVDDWVQNHYRVNFANTVRVIALKGKSRAASVAPYFNLPMDQLGAQNGEDEVAQAPLVLLHGALSSRHEAGKFYAFCPQAGVANASGYTVNHMNNLVLAFTNLKVESFNLGYPLAVASPERRFCVVAANITYSPRLTYMTTRRPQFGS